MSVALILGAGSRVGKSVASKFAENGYKVALGSRGGGGDVPQGGISVQVDVSKPEDVAAAFAKTEQEFGAPANVVIYNVAAFRPLPSAGEPFSTPYSQFLQDTVSGSLGAYVALQEAVAAFKRVGAGKPKVFIATSNILAVAPPSVNMFGLGSQKRSLAYFVQGGNAAYEKDDFRFYNAMEVSPEGGIPAGAQISGEAHAIAYWNLVQRAGRGGWDIRFVKDGSILEEN
ncbi:hypothetical protein M408DRAFT_24796 [Serendipita vermifera MAFF 305830]|uniref:NAD(P)-binding domain-containing protein n=1 Tax=Serendipita vermifera MAFF 305830 TaxID=933852 RepID=A0A0C3B6F5_SERVB|nr:hypothetical protein M408DRAFT_24796 [Serendipita vermifera MAFF 305830]